MQKPSQYRYNQNLKYQNPDAVKEKWIKIHKNINMYTDPNTMLQSVREAFTLVECVMGNILHNYREQYISYGTLIEGEKDAYVFHYPSGDIVIDFMDHSVFGMTKYLREIGYNLPNEIDDTRKLRNFISHNLETTTNDYFKDNMNYNSVIQALQNLGQSLVVMGMLNSDEVTPSFDEMRVKVGDIVGLSGEFTVDRFIAKSGTSRLYEGTHTRLNRKVAIKELLPKTFSETILFNERDLLVGLKHARIPSIYDVFNQNGTFYIIMDYIEGAGLDDYKKNHNCSMEEKLRIIHEICDVVDYLHATKGMIHADLKPQNIMIDESGRVYLIDFGMSFKKNTYTELRGVSVGFSAPELIEGKQYDYRIDIYSIGAIIKYLFSDELKNYQENKNQDLDNIVKIINTCMQQNPYSRYKNVIEIQAEINSISEYKSVSKQVVVKPKRHVDVPRLVLYTLCIAVIAVSLGIKVKSYMDSKKKSDTTSDTVLENDDNHQSTDGKDTYDFTDEQVLEEFMSLEQQAFKCLVSGDADGYVALFRYDDGAEASLRSDFMKNSADIQDIYDDCDYIILYNENGICYGCATKTLVSGEGNAARYVRIEFTYPFSYKDGKWMFDITSTVSTVTDKKVKEKAYAALTDNFNDARENGRNYTLLCKNNYLWLDSSLVYEGMLEGSVIAAAQNMDGSVELIVSIKNGTKQEKTVNACLVSMSTSQGIGIINQYRADVDVSVASGKSELVSFVIPKEAVDNISAVWDEMNAEITIQ